MLHDRRTEKSSVDCSASNFNLQVAAFERAYLSCSRLLRIAVIMYEINLK